MRYRSTTTGNILKRYPNMMYATGKSFHGLIDEKASKIYDDPEDSFADHVGILSCIKKGNIEPVESIVMDEITLTPAERSDLERKFSRNFKARYSLVEEKNTT